MKKIPALLLAVGFLMAASGHVWAEGFEYRGAPSVEVTDENPRVQQAPLSPVHLRPPIRPLITPPPAAMIEEEEFLPEQVEAAPPLPPEMPKRLSRPVFTAAPVELPKRVEAPPPAPVEIKPEPPKKIVAVKETPPPPTEPKIEKPVEKAPAQAVQEEPKAASENDTEVLAEELKKPIDPTDVAEQPVEVASEPAPPPAVPSHTDMTIAFDPTSSLLSSEAQKSLDAIAVQMKDIPDMRIQIRAYATDGGGQSSARRMSLSRALMVRSYMTDKGIKPIRLDVRALGSDTDKTPIDRVDLVFIR